MRLDIDKVTLLGGAHATPNEGLCVMERLWERVDRRSTPDGCWEWQGHRSSDGYGSLRINGRETKAHRAAWVYSGRGPIPEGLHVLHHCDNPPCCNPAHLFLGTNHDNVRDRHAKERTVGAFTSDHHPLRVLSDVDRDEAIRLRHAGHTQQYIADLLGVSRGHVAHLVSGVLPKNARCQEVTVR